jgi:hypothetical protein
MGGPKVLQSRDDEFSVQLEGAAHGWWTSVDGGTQGVLCV